jgi:motility quorum-sensing regulator / GCU-specific mRNA interferase toxin
LPRPAAPAETVAKAALYVAMRDFDGMLAVVAALNKADFFKSMTTHADHRVWQDVYCPTTPAGKVHLKLTVIDDVLIVSFKEL